MRQPNEEVLFKTGSEALGVLAKVPLVDRLHEQPAWNVRQRIVILHRNQ
jgi:hypothetical protein